MGEFGLISFFQPEGSGLSDFDLWQGEIELGLLAEEVGLDALFAVEHHFTSYSASPDNIQYLSYMAARTKRIKLVPGAVILPWHDPVRVAERITVLEYFAPGRVALAFGRGLSRVEYTAFRQDMNESRERFDEAAALILDALENGFMEGGGRFYTQPRVEIRPRPLQNFKDRLYSIGMSPASASAAADLGAVLMSFLDGPAEDALPLVDGYRNRFRELHPEQPVPVPVLAESVVCHEDADEAERLAYEYLANEFRTVVKHYELDGSHFKGTKGYETYQEMSDAINAAGGEDIAAKEAVAGMLWGTPEKITDVMRDRIDVIGDYSSLIEVAMGGIPFSDAQTTLRLFGEKIFPKVRKMRPAKTAA